MATFILTWNPDRWDWPPGEYQQAVRTTRSGQPWRRRWSVGRRREGITPGDEAYLLRQGRDRGIVASGSFMSNVELHPHWDGSGRRIPFGLVDWDVILPIEDRLPIEVLLDRVPGVQWNYMQGSGVQVQPPSDDALRGLWLQHIGESAYRSPEELPPGMSFPEGSVMRVEVNRYERDPRARSACLAHYGTRCVVCGLDFAERYGQIGQGFIHVHHLRELSTVGSGYSVDPIKDLRPVCPNCHAMLHRRRPALTIEEMRRYLSHHDA